MLLLLKNGPKTIEEIKTELEVSSSPIMAQIRILLKDGLLVQNEDSYELSVKGKHSPKMEPLLSTFQVFDENHDYWARQNLVLFLLTCWTESGNWAPVENLYPKGRISSITSGNYGPTLQVQNSNGNISFSVRDIQAFIWISRKKGLRYLLSLKGQYTGSWSVTTGKV